MKRKVIPFPGPLAGRQLIPAVIRRRKDRAVDPFPELTYASPGDPQLKQWFIRRMEHLSGRNHFAGLYNIWRNDHVGKSPHEISDMLDLIDLRLEVRGEWPVVRLPDTPLVMVANHPFGIGDGIAILSLAERLGRPFRVLINNELLKVSEIRPYSLPISFEETREAMKLNMETRHEAVRLLKQGVTIVVFPAGGVATAPKGFGRARDLPWKAFPARLVQAAGASVLPVHFEGECSRIFHIASRFSMTIRTSLLIREFRRMCGKTITATVGPILDARELAGIDDRRELTRMMHDAVFSMCPKGIGAAMDMTPPGRPAQLVARQDEGRSGSQGIAA